MPKEVRFKTRRNEKMAKAKKGKSGGGGGHMYMVVFG
jgi:hypothetical protein